MKTQDLLCDGGVYAYHVLRSALEEFGAGPASLKPEQKVQARHRADRTFALEARALSRPEAGSVSVPPERVAAAVAEVEARYDSREAFLKDLEAQCLDPDSLARALERELAFDQLMRRIAEAVPEASRGEALAFYERHPDRFVRPETRTVRHILVTVNPAYPENTRERAMGRIDGLAARLAEDPSAFAELARAQSECPSALEGGLLGQVPRGKLYPEIDAWLFSLREGEVGGPVETEVGFHLVLCEAIHPEDKVPFDTVEARIRAALTEKQRRERQKVWLERG